MEVRAFQGGLSFLLPYTVKPLGVTPAEPGVYLNELEERRKYNEEKRLAGPLRTTYQKLAYGPARDIAPILEKFLSPRGSVVFDERTNTLIITDVAR